MEAKFKEVWSRVKSTGPFDDAAELSKFIRDELKDAADYSALIRKTGALRVRKLLMLLASDERRHAKKLQAAAYMLYGDNPLPTEERQNRDERILSALRRRYAAEWEGAEAYEAAASSTANETLKKLYRELSGEERKHAEALYALLEQML